MTFVLIYISVPDQKPSLSFLRPPLPSVPAVFAKSCPAMTSLHLHPFPPLGSLGLFDCPGISGSVWVPLWVGRTWVESSLPSQEKYTGLIAHCTGSAVPAWMAHSMRTSSLQVSLPPNPRATCLTGELGNIPSALRQESMCSSDILQVCRPQMGLQWMPSAGKCTGQTRERIELKLATWMGLCGKCWCGRTLTVLGPLYYTMKWGKS